jgi:hypothetical protein
MLYEIFCVGGLISRRGSGGAFKKWVLVGVLVIAGMPFGGIKGLHTLLLPFFCLPAVG